jgi:hypothetical protein
VGAKVFTLQGQAKRFFVDRIVAQAVREGAPLSDAERQMLSFSESDREFAVDPALVEKLQAEISDEEYEAKISGLIERSWKRDVETDGSAGTLYREAFTTLSQGDHYLLIMLDRALRRRLRPWWALWR